MDQAQVDGGGRLKTSVVWPIMVSVIANGQLDQGDADEQYLLNQAIGVYKKAGEVLNSLQQYDPEDEQNPTNGDLILSQPLRWIDLDGGRRDPDKWGSTDLLFEAKFHLELN